MLSQYKVLGCLLSGFYGDVVGSNYEGLKPDIVSKIILSNKGKCRGKF